MATAQGDGAYELLRETVVHLGRTATARSVRIAMPNGFVNEKNRSK
jgi:hypothetical protein